MNLCNWRAFAKLSFINLAIFCNRFFAKPVTERTKDPETPIYTRLTDKTLVKKIDYRFCSVEILQK